MPLPVANGISAFDLRGSAVAGGKVGEIPIQVPVSSDVEDLTPDQGATGIVYMVEKHPFTSRVGAGVGSPEPHFDAAVGTRHDCLQRAVVGGGGKLHVIIARV